MEEFDYIIVGAGSTGCVLANRLSADAGTRVLLIEAGGEPSSTFIAMPKGIAKVMRDPNYAWQFPVDQPRIPGSPATEIWIRGKALGGSSSINSMIYTRGQPEDYDEWNEKAGPGWGWAEMKQAFRSIENHELGAAAWRGANGPLHIGTGKYRYPFADAAIKAGEQMGLPRKDDLNEESQEGVGYYLHTIKDGQRFSAKRAFLNSARSRANLRIVTDTYVERIMFTGRRATGIKGRAGNHQVEFHCRGDIIISAGTIMSPKILQLSGIGPGAQLKSAGIDIVAESPDVGAKMHEHLGFAMSYRLKGTAGLNWRLHGLGLVASVAQYYLFHTGILAAGAYEVGAFARSQPGLNRPDIQVSLGALSFKRDPKGIALTSAVEHQPGFTISAQGIRLTSEGTVTVKSADPYAPLSILPNWLSTEYDRRTMIGAIKYMRRYVSQPALAPYVGEETRPGASVTSDEDILNAVRLLAHCGLHAVGTCRMGNDDNAVVDGDLRVKGIDGLRVADCSVMPNIVSGNTNGPAMALGWRAADIILKGRTA